MNDINGGRTGKAGWGGVQMKGRELCGWMWRSCPGDYSALEINVFARKFDVVHMYKSIADCYCGVS